MNKDWRGPGKASGRRGDPGVQTPPRAPTSEQLVGPEKMFSYPSRGKTSQIESISSCTCPTDANF
eukprot:732922-Amorphochlora_amoeboformis.AAC.2